MGAEAIQIMVVRETVATRVCIGQIKLAQKFVQPRIAGSEVLDKTLLYIVREFLIIKVGVLFTGIHDAAHAVQSTVVPDL